MCASTLMGLNACELNQLHKNIMLDMLRITDAICKKHNIKYMLFAGTALGAVRHQGFIPWDDDLDIVMLRSEYNRFLEVAEIELDKEKYYLQKEFSSHWPMFFTKLRKNNTACMERYIPKDDKTHQGIYIDIFPCDNLSDSHIIRKIQFLASKVVIAKSLDKRGYLTDSIGKKAFMLFCRCLPLKLMHKITCGNDLKNTKLVHTFLGASSKYKKSVYPREWFTNVVYTKFGDEEYPISAYYDEMLTQLYGDYMTPHTPDERKCKVHADLVDTEKSYTEYLEWQKQQKITVYTRSIR